MASKETKENKLETFQCIRQQEATYGYKQFNIIWWFWIAYIWYFCILSHLHFVSFAFCYNCIMSHLHFVTIALCLICILLHLQFVPFAFCYICILPGLHFVWFAFCLFLTFCYICILSNLHFVTDSANSF